MSEANEVDEEKPGAAIFNQNNPQSIIT